MTTRTFTREELDEIGVPFDCGAFDGSAEEIRDELYDTSRWSEIFRFIFRAPDDGKVYEVYYEIGATEMQDQDVWNWEDRIRAVEVEEVQVMITAWKPVKEKS